MMLETRKFNADGTYIYAGLDNFSGAILESAPPSDIEEKLIEYNFEWL